MKILWLCGLPRCIQQSVPRLQGPPFNPSWSWILGHLPPPSGVELHLACPQKRAARYESLEYHGAHVHIFPYIRGSVYMSYWNWMPGFRRIYQSVQPDWVHGWGTESGYGVSALRLTKKRSIVSIQGLLSDYRPYMKETPGLAISRWIERLTLRKAQRLLAESRYSADSAGTYTNGTMRQVKHPLREEFRTASPAKGENRRLLYIGTLDRRKGAEDAVRGFLASELHDWELIFIGTGEDRVLKRLRDVVDSSWAAQRVRFEGECDVRRMIDIMKSSSVFFLPSYMDTGPTALKEALAMGLWPLCYDNTGPRELIREYGCGTLVQTGNIAALGEALRHLNDTRPWKNDERRKEGVDAIRRDLSCTSVWDALVACYDESAW